MLFETLFQANIFLSIMYFGIICGLVYEITHLFKFKKYILCVLQDLFFMLIFSVIYIICVHILCFGEFRFYTIFAFIVGFLIERKSIGKIVALFLNMIYNICVKFLTKLKQTKLYRALSKLLRQIYKKINFVKIIKEKIKNKRVQEK